MVMLAITLVAMCLWQSVAYADRCLAEAEFIHSFPTNKDNSRFKFKFRVASENCTTYGCTGYIRHRIHFEWATGGSSATSTLVSYRIPAGQRSVEVVHEMFPASGPNANTIIRDVEVGEVSCSTP
jgi:hypothetical protein